MALGVARSVVAVTPRSTRFDPRLAVRCYSTRSGVRRPIAADAAMTHILIKNPMGQLSRLGAATIS